MEYPLIRSYYAAWISRLTVDANCQLRLRIWYVAIYMFSKIRPVILSCISLVTFIFTSAWKSAFTFLLFLQYYSTGEIVGKWKLTFTQTYRPIAVSLATLPLALRHAFKNHFNLCLPGLSDQSILTFERTLNTFVSVDMARVSLVYDFSL